jgi:FkbM family methyltransferase
VDIGASNGVSNSNSRYFVHLGWRVVLFEPDPVNYGLLVQNTNVNETKVEMHNLAIGNKRGTLKFKSEGGLSRLDANGDIKVDCVKVSDMFWPDSKIGILDIDTEGGEENILKQFFMLGISPSFVIIEHQNDQHKMNVQGELLNNKYKRIRREGVNDIWALKSL